MNLCTGREVELYRRHFSSESVLVNRYAATETGIICWYVMNRQTVLPEGPVPIGYPVEGTEVLLLDDAGTPVRKGEIGEIAVKSSYLSPGYWNRPELTRGSVFSNPRRARQERSTARVTWDVCLRMTA